MDSFDLESLNKTISGFKTQLKNKFSKLTLNSKEVKNNVESLCLIWDYSPRLNDERKHFEQFKINPDIFKFHDKDLTGPEKSQTFVYKEHETLDNSIKKLDSPVPVQEQIKLQKKKIIITGGEAKPSSKDKLGENPSLHNSYIRKNSKIHNKEILKNIELKKSHEKGEVLTEQDEDGKDQDIDIDNSSNESKKDVINKTEKQEKNKDDENSDIKDFKDENKYNNDNNDNSIEEEDKEAHVKSAKDKDVYFNESYKSQDLDTRIDKKKHRLTENRMMRIYLFNTQKYVDIQVFFGEKIKDLKRKVLTIITYKEKDTSTSNDKTESNYYCNVYGEIVKKLKYPDNPDAFEIRMADEDDDVVANLDFPAFEDNLNLINSKMYNVCMLEKAFFNPNESHVGVKLGIFGSKVVVKIHIKAEIDKGELSTIIEENKDKTVKDLFERVKNKLTKNNIKNFDYYCFFEHSPEDTTKCDNKKTNMIDDLDSEISLDLQLKYLTVFELDVSSLIFLNKKIFYIALY
jgi:hypothetical protein